MVWLQLLTLIESVECQWNLGVNLKQLRRPNLIPISPTAFSVEWYSASKDSGFTQTQSHSIVHYKHTDE